MENHSNEARRFIQYSVKSMEAKRFTLIYLEGTVLDGEWSILTKKLRVLGVVSFSQFQQ